VTSRVQLHLLRHGEVVHEVDVPSGGLTIGRAPENSLTLGEGSVSRQHAQVFWLDGQAWLRDLETTNGTWVNRVRLVGVHPLQDRDEVRFGDHLTCRVRGGPASPSAPDDALVVLEDEWTLVRVALEPGDWALDARGMLQRTDASPDVAVGTDGTVRVREVRGVRLVEPGERFLLNNRTWRRVQAAAVVAATRGTAADVLPYRLDASLSGRGPAAYLSEGGGKARRVCGGNGAVVLYLLARQLERDRTAGLGQDREGWVDDDNLGRGVWGRQWSSRDPNGLHVLLYRLRKSIERAGFDPTCLDKRRGETRLKVAAVNVEEQ